MRTPKNFVEDSFGNPADRILIRVKSLLYDFLSLKIIELDILNLNHLAYCQLAKHRCCSSME